MNLTQTEIRANLEEMTKRNRALTEALTDRVSLTDYAHLVREGNIWTDALQAALNEHEIIVIPASSDPYMIDNTVTIPSGRRIEAEGATVRLCEGVRVLMLRNEHTQNGTHAPIPKENRDGNITILGGRWEESNPGRAGYGRTGMYDLDRSFFGVSTCMLFNNMDGLTLKNLTFSHTAGFAVQMGDITDVHCENIRFDECFADGLHINGNTKNVITRNLYGEVGDDLVALNMYDWQNSSVNFGPTDMVLCENMHTAPGDGYKAMRIEPGLYFYDDGSSVDCALTNAIISDVSGVNVFKMYYQTPGYIVGTDPERGGLGSLDNLFFEHIDIDLDAPGDAMKPYLEGDPVTGAFSPFEINANVGKISLEDINLTLYDRFPTSCLMTVGPKSVRSGDREVFDPYLGGTVECVSLKNIRINGTCPDDISPYIREIVFDHLYDDGPSTARGTIRRIEYEKGAE